MASGASPPKPWERAAAAGGLGAASSASLNLGTAATPSLDATAATPALPARPDALNTIASRTASNYSTPFNRPSPYSSYSSPYGMGAMGGMSGMSSYSSPYSRFGGGMYGSSMMGNSMYGGGFGGYGGMGGYGMGAAPGMYGPNGDQTLTQSFSNSTQATFQMIESIVGAFGGFAQMLESTYGATYNSFYAMVSVAEQFGNLKQTLGSVLGIFAIMRWLRSALAKVQGKPPPASPKSLTPANFAAFSGVPGAAPEPKPSRKPFIFFLVAVFGLPYLMGKLIRALAASQEAEQQRLLAQQPPSLDDPTKLEFYQVLYDYTPQTQPGQAFQEGLDLAVKKGDHVIVLAKTDPMGQPSEWWRCVARDRKEGYLPAPYLAPVQRRAQAAAQAQIAAGRADGTSSRVNTLTGTVLDLPGRNTAKAGAADAAGQRAETMKITAREKEAVQATSKIPPAKKAGAGMLGDMTMEGFQRAGFYS